MMLRCLAILISLLLGATLAAMTREEAAHVGQPFITPPIVEKFLSSSVAHHPDLRINNFELHHKIVSSFCRKCTWEEYYQLLDHIRLPYKNLFDPGAEVGSDFRSLRNQRLSGNNQHQCPVISTPSAAQFLTYVQASQPVIIRPKRRPNTSIWSNAYLSQALRHAEVVVSASPTSDYDGPESYELWGVPDDPHSTLIVRPAHIQMTFPQFLSLLQTPNVNISNFYLEYFPIEALVNASHLLAHVPSHLFADFLATRYHLLWMGGGYSRNLPTSRLHFDRNENLMTMMRGRKTFYLYDPSQSVNVYGGEGVRSAAFQFVGNISHGDFVRPQGKVSEELNTYHTYSPVDIMNPDFAKHPRFRNAKQLVCTIEPGDTLYLPSHWWHQVVSEPDEEGKSIGLNKFFEPYYHRYGMITTSNIFQRNRYYAHIYDMNIANVCARRSRQVCYSNRKRKSRRSRRKAKPKKRSRSVRSEL